jgi:hypothetical protein
MDTTTVAKRLIELFNEGKASQAQEELYHADVVNYEQSEGDRSETHGKEAVMANTAWFFGNSEIRTARAEVAFVNHDTFLVKFMMDVTIPGVGEMVGDEYGLYKVRDGMIVEEYFYMAPVA